MLIFYFKLQLQLINSMLDIDILSLCYYHITNHCSGDTNISVVIRYCENTGDNTIG